MSILKYIFLLSLIIFVTSCNEQEESNKSNESTSEVDMYNLNSVDEVIDLRNQMEGEFIGEFYKCDLGMYTSLIFKDGRGETSGVSDVLGDYVDKTTLTNLHGEEYVVRSEEYKESTLLDSLNQFPELFEGKLLKVKWSKFTFEGQEEGPSVQDPIILNISYPN